MSESIINALMHLFAIIESVKEGIVDTGEIVVKPYLKKKLNQDLAVQYLSLYQDYVDFYRRESTEVSSERELELETNNILQVTKICNQLNYELLQHERVILFIQLIELINTDNKVSPKENDFIKLVALNFNLSTEELKDIKSFILDDGKDISIANGLIIDNRVTEWPKEIAWMMKKKNVPGVNEFRHIYVKNLFGKIIILHIKSTHTLVCRYIGPLNIYLEGNKVVSGKSYLLNPGSIIKGANIKPIYETEIAKTFLQNKKKIKLVMHGDNMTFKFKNSDNGIQPFTFYEESGQMLGIMGGSGTGKSTLLNLLNGKLEPTSGKVQINGHSISKCVQEGVIGYVPQDDLLFEELTVYQNLYFNARLCFGDFSESRVRAMVNRVLKDLDIDEICDLQVGSPLNKFISGGQRKRVNIGLELMREPSVLFVDEPTSGLSSMDSQKVMRLLKEQGQKGKLVIVIIHQPSSDTFKLFDKLWILDKGGYPIYNGNPIDSVVYFKTMNTQVNAAESECRTCGNVIPEQVLHIIESKKINEQGSATAERRVSPAQWYDKYKENILNKVEAIKWQEALPPSNFQIPGLLQQLNLFVRRTVLSKGTNKQYILLNLLEPPLLAFILGYLSKYSPHDTYVFSENKNLPVYLFMTVVVSLFLGLTVSAEEIFKDRKILERESFLNLSRLSYLNSKILYLFALSAVQMLIFVVIGNSILEIQGLTFSYWLILFSTACFANMVGLNISSGLNSIVTIYILIPLILVPQLLLGGAMIKFDELHYSISKKEFVPFIGDTMASRWAYEALAVEQFRSNKYEKQFYDQDQSISSTGYNSSLLIPRLESALNDAFYTKNTLKDRQKTEKKLTLLSNEIKRLESKDDNRGFVRHDRLTYAALDSNTYNYTKNYLTRLKKKYQKQRRKSSGNREDILKEISKEHGKDYVTQLKRQHHNKAITSLALNRDQIQKIYTTNNKLIQKKDPVLMIPDSPFGRAHFYAPKKRIGNILIDTFYFNIIALWILSAFLYFALINDTLRKILEMLAKLGSFNNPR